MRDKLFFFACVVGALAGLTVYPAAQDKAKPSEPAASERLQKVVDDAARAALERFKEKGLAEKHLAITLIDLTDPARPERASFRGAEPIYPASVVKLFYLAAAHCWLEDGRLKESEELTRALHDMIVDSSNDATHMVLDSLTGVTARPVTISASRRAVASVVSLLRFSNFGPRNCRSRPYGPSHQGFWLTLMPAGPTV